MNFHGPWSMEKDNDLIIDSRGYPVAEGDLSLRGHYGDAVERLILAAPELLEFVEKLRDQDLDMETGGNALNDERDAILARIEKGTI
jgi:hypothetical protein